MSFGAWPALRTAAAIAALAGSAVFGQQVESAATGNDHAAAQVSFSFDRPGLPVPRFTLTVNEDGSARYEADEVLPSRDGSSNPLALQHVDRQLVLSQPATAQIFNGARALDRFTVKCATEAKNIADTGSKTLRYTGRDGEGSCVYNYAQDKRVMALTDLFLGIARTQDLGRKLEFDHRFDRLGLDATSEILTSDVAAGRAVEVGTISTTLKSLVQDSQVLERVRLRAARLLQRAQQAS